MPRMWEARFLAPLPKDVEALKGGHFNRTVNAAVLSLHHKGTVTQPLIHDNWCRAASALSRPHMPARYRRRGNSL